MTSNFLARAGSNALQKVLAQILLKSIALSNNLTWWRRCPNKWPVADSAPKWERWRTSPAEWIPHQWQAWLGEVPPKQNPISSASSVANENKLLQRSIFCFCKIRVYIYVEMMDGIFTSMNHAAKLWIFKRKRIFRITVCPSTYIWQDNFL